ncbi:MAG: holo-ACP synthase [Oscillospiraceae bacterium]|jgi:holo-[acyl-carrier protein] synthase|nr:holo-ACP synthase [Oscillospiraceae bacterium]
MIVGLGIDLCNIERFSDTTRRDRFIERYFAPEERERVVSGGAAASDRAAGIFAAKEAALKALGVGIGAIPLTDIVIIYNKNGAPLLTFTGKARSVAESLGVARMHLSITHEYGVAAAVVILEE